MRSDLTSPERFEQLVREHQATVFRTLYRLTGAGAHLEDLAQEVFLRLYRALPEFRGEAMLSTYLYRITVNVAHDEWKRRRRDRDNLQPAPVHLEEDYAASWLENQAAAPAVPSQHNRTPEQCLRDTELREVVGAAMLCLPEAERAVVALYHGEELSYEGIAAALGIPVNTVRTHLHRGRKRLAGLVQQRLEVPVRSEVYARERRA
jgi:RNA polymerase sigma-70 factor, ECF subfamily